MSGVVRDFNYLSLHRNNEPLTLPLEPYANRYLSLKINPENLSQTIFQIERIWKELAPHRPFLYSNKDRNIQNIEAKDHAIIRDP